MIAINWPLAVTDLSERDRSHPRLDTSFAGIDA
jgi:dTDP-4-dehydrorhamnose 3,5-epimerase-like enzyme